MPATSSQFNNQKNLVKLSVYMNLDSLKVGAVTMQLELVRFYHLIMLQKRYTQNLAAGPEVIKLELRDFTN